MVGTTTPPSVDDGPSEPLRTESPPAGTDAGASAGVAPFRSAGAEVLEMAPGAHPAASNLFTGMPPLLMLGLGIVMGTTISFAIGVVVWSVFR